MMSLDGGRQVLQASISKIDKNSAGDGVMEVAAGPPGFGLGKPGWNRAKRGVQFYSKANKLVMRFPGLWRHGCDDGK